MKIGIAIFAYTYEETVERESLNKADLRNCISIQGINPKMTQKFQNNLKDMFIDMIGEKTFEKNLPTKIEEVKCNEDKNINIVYDSNSSAIGTDRFSVTDKELKDKFLKNKHSHEIFIYHRSVMKKVKSRNSDNKGVMTLNLELDENIFKLLVLFLKYKDINITYWDLYNFAWQKSPYYAADNESNEVCMMNSLKNAVSKLRRTFADIKEFKIPNARGGGYTCQGDFNFCVIMNESNDNLFTLDKI